jgi:hypothetical protein
MDSGSESSSSAQRQSFDEEERAGPSKRKPTSKSKQPAKKGKIAKTTTTPREKATATGIDYDMVCSHPTITYLRQCINTINGSLPARAPRLSKKGDKTTLLKAIYDFLDVSEEERGPIPVSALQQQRSDSVMFMNINRGHITAQKWKKDIQDASSVKSFEDCKCPRCRGKRWQAPGDVINDGGSVQAPIIPKVLSIEDAIQQVDDGILEKISQKYRKTEYWKKLQKLYSERYVLYKEYQRNGSDLQQLLDFHFGNSQETRTYKRLMKLIGQWNAQQKKALN